MCNYIVGTNFEPVFCETSKKAIKYAIASSRPHTAIRNNTDPVPHNPQNVQSDSLYTHLKLHTFNYDNYDKLPCYVTLQTK